MSQSSREEKWIQWMVDAQKGDPVAYRALLTDIHPVIHRFVSSKIKKYDSEVDDLVQDILMSIHRSRATFHSSRSFSAWMFAISRHKVIDFYRRKGVRQEVSIDQLDEKELQTKLSAEDPFHLKNLENSHEELISAVEKLPEKQKEALKLTKIEGLSTEEAAQKIGVSAGALRVRVHRAYETLRSSLKGKRT